MLQLDPSDLLTFVRVVEQGSLSAAARLLGVPRSTVTRRLARLEDQIGRTLVSRTTRTSSVTPDGEAVYARASSVLENLLLLEADVLHPEGTPAGLVRVTGPAEMSAGFITEVVGPMLEAWPEVRVELVFTNRYVDLVGESFDLAIRAGTLPDSTLTVRKLIDAGLQLFASPALVASGVLPDDVYDLERAPLVLAPPVQRTLLLLRGEEEVTLYPNARVLVSDFLAAREAAVAGLGVTVLAAFAAFGDVRAGRLVRVYAPWRSTRGSVHLVSPPGRLNRPAVRELADRIIAWFAGKQQELDG